MDDRRGVHSRGIAKWLVEEFEGASETEVGILDAKRGRWDDREGFGNDHGCGLGKPGCGGILWVGDEGDFSWASLLDAVEAGDLGVGRTIFEARVEGGGDLRKFHGRWMDASKSYTSSEVVQWPD